MTIKFTRYLIESMFDKFTDGELIDARKHAAKINHTLADEAFTTTAGFADHVTDTDKLAYQKKNKKLANEIEAGEHDDNFTVAQRMYYFLTGKAYALLPK